MRYLLITTMIFLTGCGSKKSPLLGTWKSSAFFSAEQVKQKSPTLQAKGVEMNLSELGSLTFQIDRSYTIDSKLSITITTSKKQHLLQVKVKRSGTWEKKEGTLMFITRDAAATAIDEETKAYVAKKPEFLAGLTPKKGDTTSHTIISMSDKEVVLEDVKLKVRTFLTRE